MNYHLKSLIITSLLWISFILLLTISLTHKTKIIPVSLEIKIESSGQVTHRHLDVKNTENKGVQEDYHRVTNDSDRIQSEHSIEPIYQPLPEIPDDLRSEAFSSLATARFYIDEEGNVERVELIQPASNPKLNQLLLKSLKKWKFSASNRAMSKDIKVNFEVK